MDLAAYSAKGRTNHSRWCTGTQTTEPPPLGGSLDTDDVSSDVSSDDVHDRETVLEHQQALADAGTLDAAFLVRLAAPAKHVTTEERAVIRFLRATETGAWCSRRQVEALLHHARSLGGEGLLLPKSYQKLWNCVETAHGRMMPPLTTKRIAVPVPASVRCLLTQGLTHLHFNHVDPTEAPVRMLVTGPLAADKRNLKIFPRARSEHLDDYCDGSRLRRFDTCTCVSVCKYVFCI
jgi:hypothetical protein